MADQQLTAAKRRLNRILADEELGPALARLNRKQETEVLDLVYRNQGREARAKIVQYDTKRKRRRTVADRAKRYASKSKVGHVSSRTAELAWLDGDQDLETEFWRHYDGAVSA